MAICNGCSVNSASAQLAIPAKLKPGQLTPSRSHSVRRSGPTGCCADATTASEIQVKNIVRCTCPPVSAREPQVSASMSLRNSGMKNRRDSANVFRGVRFRQNIFQPYASSLFGRQLFFRLEEVFHLM